MKTKTGLFFIRIWLPVLLLGAWWIASYNSTSVYFPSLQSILETFVRDWLGPRLWTDLLPSIGKFLIGFLIAAVSGIVFGLFIGLTPVLRSALDPVIHFLRSLPPPVLLPIGLLVFGIGAPMNIAIIAFGSVWPTLLNTIDGVRGIDSQLLDVGRSYRLTRAQRIKNIILPAASPQIMSGLRTTLQLSIILIVVAEMVAATRGIGFYVLNSQQTFAVRETWAGTIVLGLLGYCAALIFITVEKRVLSWQQEESE